ncbi:MAG: hypothetical protein LKJ75_02405 [Clostridia bacterium]|jgi:flagellar biosynthesis/type III secretory pathway protein FliH|nr:hypothetical protein [Clostridia bacterium]MCI2014035.1 hypothetical protein [Clostridia bacterium]
MIPVLTILFGTAILGWLYADYKNDKLRDKIKQQSQENEYEKYRQYYKGYDEGYSKGYDYGSLTKAMNKEIINFIKEEK